MERERRKKKANQGINIAGFEGVVGMEPKMFTEGEGKKGKGQLNMSTRRKRGEKVSLLILIYCGTEIIMLELCPIFGSKYSTCQLHVHSTAVYSIILMHDLCQQVGVIYIARRVSS